jgi:hypothetical protein
LRRIYEFRFGGKMVSVSVDCTNCGACVFSGRYA